MKTTIAAICFLTLQAVSASAGNHCADDVKSRATSLLTLHFNDGREGEVNLQIDDKITKIEPVAALKGDGKFDVFEVYGYIYKATYRMRFIYAQIADSCVLMGQELIEVADPY
jgi:hypothetical protein